MGHGVAHCCQFVCHPKPAAMAPYSPQWPEKFLYHEGKLSEHHFPSKPE